jgi:hypothetical protein
MYCISPSLGGGAADAAIQKDFCLYWIASTCHAVCFAVLAAKGSLSKEPLIYSVLSFPSPTEAFKEGGNPVE